MEFFANRQAEDDANLPVPPKVYIPRNTRTHKGKKLLGTGIDSNTIELYSTIESAIEEGFLVLPGAVGTGDMVEATYDPTGVNGDAFDMDNMVESATSKVLTNVERLAIAANSNKVDSVVAGTNVTVDNTDPLNPIVSATSGSTTLQEAFDASSVPQITTDLTNTALILQGNSGADTNEAIRILNSVGIDVFNITGEGNLSLSGTVDGRDIASDGSTLDTHVGDLIKHIDWSVDQGVLNIHPGNYNVGSSTLQDAYDASTPTEIVTDSTNGALTLKRGSAVDTDFVFIVQNGAGVSVSGISGEGQGVFDTLSIVGDTTTGGRIDGRFVGADGSTLDTHVGDVTGNPHAVTLAQVGVTNSDDIPEGLTNLYFPGFTSLLTDYSFTDNSSDWNTAYGWGDHSGAGYLTGITGENFTNLSDTPSTYVSHSLKGVRVNAGETALEFFTLAGATDELVKFNSGDTTAGYVEDKFSAGTGISIAEGSGATENKLVITNSAPDQTVSFTGGTNVTIGGTYPNFTITDDSQVAGTYLTSETSHADVLVDGDFATPGLMATDGAGTYSIITNNSTNWNTAYGWGDHSGLYDATGTASGLIGTHESTYNHSHYDTAYSWGNHASAGYLTSETSHADVVVDGDFTSNGILKRTSSGVYGIVTDNSTNWDTAYGWGNHASAGYLTSASPVVTDNVFRIQDNGDNTKKVAFEVSGVTTGTTRTLTVPNSNGTIYVTSGTDVSVADGGTGRSTGTTAYSLIATGTTATGAQQTLANGLTTQILVGGGASALPAWTTATGSGSPVRATAPTMTSPIFNTSAKFAGELLDGTNSAGAIGDFLVSTGAASAPEWTTVTVPYYYHDGETVSSGNIDIDWDTADGGHCFIDLSVSGATTTFDMTGGKRGASYGFTITRYTTPVTPTWGSNIKSKTNATPGTIKGNYFYSVYFDGTTYFISPN